MTIGINFETGARSNGEYVSGVPSTYPLLGRAMIITGVPEDKEPALLEQIGHLIDCVRVGMTDQRLGDFNYGHFDEDASAAAKMIIQLAVDAGATSINCGRDYCYPPRT